VSSETGPDGVTVLGRRVATRHDDDGQIRPRRLGREHLFERFDGRVGEKLARDDHGADALLQFLHEFFPRAAGLTFEAALDDEPARQLPITRRSPDEHTLFHVSSPRPVARPSP
jgi:hypothetical protein